MRYVGIHTQQRKNNFRSVMLLVLFPLVILSLTWLFFWIYGLYVFNNPEFVSNVDMSLAEWVNYSFLEVMPLVIGGCLIWFLIAYFTNTAIINRSTSAKPLNRRENKRVYNLVENLCIANNMAIPKINIIEDSSLNAFASGINQKSYTVTLSSGIIEKLSDEELESVIAHELTHIRNRDVRLLIVSIVFVGIFSFLTQILLRSMFHVRIGGRNNKNGGSTALIMLIVLVLSVVGYFISALMRFAISRKREYMADAGSAEMTHKPWALASALRKISGDPLIEAVEQKDVAQLFIDNPLKKKRSASGKLFATHPPIDKRIQILEQF